VGLGFGLPCQASTAKRGLGLDGPSIIGEATWLLRQKQQVTLVSAASIQHTGTRTLLQIKQWSPAFVI